MDGANPTATPLVSSASLSLVDGFGSCDETLFRRVLGSLQYLSLTRPDIAFAVNKLSQFMHKPTENHWTTLKRVLRYLKGTISHELFLPRCRVLIYGPSLMMIGPEIRMINPPLVPMLFFWEIV